MPCPRTHSVESDHNTSGVRRLLRTMMFGRPNGSVTQLRRGNRRHWRRGTALAATNEMSAGASCKRRDATALGRLTSRLGRRANERPAVSCCDELGGPQPRISVEVDIQRVLTKRNKGRRSEQHVDICVDSAWCNAMLSLNLCIRTWRIAEHTY